MPGTCIERLIALGSTPGYKSQRVVPSIKAEPDKNERPRVEQPVQEPINIPNIKEFTNNMSLFFTINSEIS
jgi:hypothetical protein